MAWATIAQSTALATYGGTDVSEIGSGTVLATVTAAHSSDNANTQAYWRIRQQFYRTSSAFPPTLVGSAVVEAADDNNPVGHMFVAPTIVVSGNQIAVQFPGHPDFGSVWGIFFKLFQAAR